MIRNSPDLTEREMAVRRMLCRINERDREGRRFPVWFWPLVIFGLLAIGIALSGCEPWPLGIDTVADIAPEG